MVKSLDKVNTARRSYSNLITSTDRLKMVFKMNRRTTISTCSITLLLLSGCATHSYTRTDFNPQQFAADQAFCNAQANTARLGSFGLAGAAIFKQNKDMCMVGKGYTSLCDGIPCDPQY